MTCLYSNIRSVAKNAADLENYILAEKIDLAFLTETWLKKKQSSEALLSNTCKTHQVYRVDRPLKKGGGVAIIMLNEAKFESVMSVSIPNGFELLCGDIYIEQSELRLICVYRPPSCDAEKSEKLMEMISDLVCCSKPCLISGDFNLPDIDWSVTDIKSSNSLSSSFLDIFKSNGLTQYVKDGTRKSNILDLVLTNDDKLLTKIDTKPSIGSSDHESLIFGLSFTYTKPLQMFKQLFHKADYDKINEHLLGKDWTSLFSCIDNVNDAYECFLSQIKDTIMRYVPFSLVNLDVRGMPDYIVKMYDHRHHLWSNARKSKLDIDWKKYRKYTRKFTNKLNKYNRSIEKN